MAAIVFCKDLKLSAELTQSLGDLGVAMRLSHDVSTFTSALQQPTTSLVCVALAETTADEREALATILRGDEVGVLLMIVDVLDDQGFQQAEAIDPTALLATPFHTIELNYELRNLLSILENRQQQVKVQERAIQEQSIVENIFANALSRNMQDYPHIDTILLPFTTFNGDLYLFARGPLGSIYLLLGDFTGHGLPAAIGTLPTAQTFFAMAKRGAPVSKIVYEVNQQLHQLLPTSLFFCATVIELSASGRHLSWWSGGMPPAFIVDEEGKVSEELTPQHLPLGVLNADEFDSALTFTYVSAGARLILYTDGVIELGAQHNRPLGYQGFQQLGSHVNWEINALKDALLAERESRGANDDLSLVKLCCVPTGLDPSTRSHPLTPLPFRIKLRLTSEVMRRMDPVEELLSGIGQLRGFAEFKAGLYTVITEAYNNALEHGILQLSSDLKQQENGFERYYQERTYRLSRLRRGLILIELDYQPTENKIRIAVEDDGDGFDCDALEEHSMQQVSGRGLMLIRELTTQVSWSKGGRRIEFSYALEQELQRSL